ncbi:MAG TPA: DoxX family protein [Flavobacterium sp.]|uniref:DoxX family protein n=1 Tax=unclassified Flavobacterium TaxID=196869 RepID=UPI000E91BAAF|nr:MULTISPECIES: DoxX family protein [unclassified Flavobacterium]HBI00114.1 DoxX family protein [Flavobacterium sp.]HRE77784.1 DoxX family protein [Flavobacterium sp.]
MKIVKLVLFTLFGLMFINAGLDKFLHYMPVPPLEPEVVKAGEAFMTITWLMPLVGAVELLAGLLFIFPKTRFLGALMIFPVMVGIMLHNAVYMPSGLAIAGVFFLINLWVFYENKEKIKGIVI